MADSEERHVSADSERLIRVVGALPEAQQRQVLEFALMLHGKRFGRTTSFLDVPDPMPAEEAEEFARAIEEAFETIDPHD